MNIPWPNLSLPSVHVTFEWPMMLAGLLLAPLLLLLYLLAQRRRRAYTLRFTNLALLSQVVGRAPAWRRHVPPVLYLLGLAALLVSLARPSAVVALPQDQSSVVLVIDVSGSMNADDLQPYRMEAAKLAARSFVDHLPDQAQAGLVRFSQSASVAAPLTRDHRLVARSIDQLSANGGTAIGDGLALALDLLAQRPTGLNAQRAPGTIVLLSDGASTFGIPPEEAALRAQREGIKVYTVGVGQRGATPLIGGRQPARLDEATLQQIASVSGGEYFYAAETNDLTQIYADLGSQIEVVEEETEITALLAGLATGLLVVGGLLGLRWFQQLP
jgi:Ca-activated chloride channel family protein